MLGWQRIGILLFEEEQFSEEKLELDFQAAPRLQVIQSNSSQANAIARGRWRVA